MTRTEHFSSIIRRAALAAATATITIAVIAAPAFGNLQGHITVTIPFAFSAGETVLPAGKYTVTGIGDSVLKLRTEDGNASAMVIVRVEGSAKAGDGIPTLVFNRYGSESFLSEVRTGWDGSGYKLGTSHVQERLARTSTFPKEVLLLKASNR